MLINNNKTNTLSSTEKEYVSLVATHTKLLFELFENKNILSLGQDVFGTQQEFVKRLVEVNNYRKIRRIDQPHDKIIEELYNISFGTTA